MRAKKSIILREIAGENILVPVGAGTGEVMGIMTLNDSGRYLWRKLEERDCTAAALVDALLEEYEVERSTATTDVDNFITMLKTTKLLE